MRSTDLSSSSRLSSCHMSKEDNSLTIGATDCVKKTIGQETLSSVNDLLETRPSKKRKILPDEIEVDITASKPLSKKEVRLLKKGKPSLPSKAVPFSVGENELLSKKSDFGVWIGNLSYLVSKDQIRKFLIDNSEISDEMIWRIHMPVSRDIKLGEKNEGNKHEKKLVNKGFAYVDFSNIESVNQAVQLSERLLNGRRVLIKDKNSFEGRPLKVIEQAENDGKPPSKRVFLGNLSFDVTEQVLKEQFNKCGPIKDIKVATFEDTGKCKGFAWIEFEDLEGAKNAVRGFINLKEAVNLVSTQTTPAEDNKKLEEIKKAKVKHHGKQWVNKLNGRILRVEFAEHSQLRYKKRFGKDVSNHDGKIGKAKSLNGKELMRAYNKVEYRQPYAPRLTGGIIESRGVKTTF